MGIRALLKRVFPKARVLPTTLRHRLVAAYILLILLPFSLLMIHHFSKLETVLRDTFSEQSLSQMQQINQSFEDIISEAYKTSVLLDQDSRVQVVLQYPQAHNAIERVNYIEERFRAINNSVFLTTPHVYFTIADLYGHVYSSFMPAEPFKPTFLDDSGLMRQVLDDGLNYAIDVERNYVSTDRSISPELLSLHIAMLNGRYEPYAVLRISIDYQHWFQSLTRRYPDEHRYALVREDGKVDIRAKGDIGDISFAMLAEFAEPFGTYEKDGFIINYSLIPSLGWYLVKQVPVDHVFTEVQGLKKSFTLTFIIFTAAFIMITYIISLAITNPLKRLQVHMSNVAQSNLKIHLNEERQSGEMLALTKSFNTMVSEIHDLIQKLKQEERRKEAVHFRMLHSQTNPHFLLNTLNTIKWIAWNQENKEVVDICISLGKLLEAGLNSDKELIHLKDEIELINAYIRIQQYRYKTNYNVQFHYDEQLAYALIPKLSLQPLVDNAIDHGFAGRDKGNIKITVEAQDDMLHVKVEDDGIGIEAAKQHNGKSRKGHGIGLNNLKERLELLFKQKAKLDIIELSEGTVIHFQMPLLIAEPYEKEDN